MLQNVIIANDTTSIYHLGIICNITIIILNMILIFVKLW